MPASWSPNIVSFKIYNTNTAEGLALWEAVNGRLNQPQIAGLSEEPSRFGEPHLIRPRLGQGAFRVLVTDIYRRRCAVTQERTLPALEAAHIRPYGDGGAHEARNGLLLRRDIHSLFDAGYVTVSKIHHAAFDAHLIGIDPDYRLHVSERLRGQNDGPMLEALKRLHGGTIHLPNRAKDLPDRDRLALRFERFMAAT